MNSNAEKTPENKSKAVADSVAKRQPGIGSSHQPVNNRPESIAQRKLQEIANNSLQVKQLQAIQEIADSYTLQKKEYQEKKLPTVKKELIQKQAKQVNTSSPGNVIQRAPADWVASADITRMLGHAHGWFSTWKKIKAKIAEYKLLLPGALDARRTKLDEIRPLIVEWEADGKHTAASKERRVINIRADMPTLKTLVETEYTQIAIATDALTGGHSETRHGADLTDQQLTTRLTTGLDRSGAAAPADLSTKFKSHDLLVSTKNEAVNRLNTARANTLTHFNAGLTQYLADWLAFDALPGLAKGDPASPQRLAKDASRAAIDALALAMPATNLNMLKVTIGQFPGGTNAGNIATRINELVKIRNRYSIVINHGVDIGKSLAGTGPPGGPHPASVPAPSPQKTMTIYSPVVGPLINAGSAAGWPMITHYPHSDATADQISQP